MAGTILRKISPKTVMGEMTKPTQETWLYRVFGTVVSAEIDSKNSAFGEYARLIGEFQAIRFDTGEQFSSGECFLVAGIGEMIAARLAKNADGGETPSAINIVFDIGYRPDNRKNSQTGYEFMIRNPDEQTEQQKQAILAVMSLPLPPGLKTLPPAFNQ
jgi:hypothetical protein